LARRVDEFPGRKEAEWILSIELNHLQIFWETRSRLAAWQSEYPRLAGWLAIRISSAGWLAIRISFITEDVGNRPPLLTEGRKRTQHAEVLSGVKPISSAGWTATIAIQSTFGSSYFSRSTRFAYCCTAQIPKFQSKTSI
jgi:hypothetical protein